MDNIDREEERFNLEVNTFSGQSNCKQLIKHDGEGTVSNQT